jgi:lauroyl/myristoyl acyltransferase
VEARLDFLFAGLIRVCARLPRVLSRCVLWLVIEAFDLCVPRFRLLARRNMTAAGVERPGPVWRRLKRAWLRSLHRLVHMRCRADIAGGWALRGLQNLGEPVDSAAHGAPILFAFLHLGPWEEGLQVLGENCEGALGLVRRLPFAGFAKEVQSRRDHSGLSFLDCQSGGRALVKHLSAGGVGFVAADLHPSSGGFVMEWLGQPTWVDDKAARLAQQTGSTLLPVWCEEGVAHIERAIDTSDPIEATRELMRLAEARIRQHPHLWIWMHSRWREKAP